MQILTKGMGEDKVVRSSAIMTTVGTIVTAILAGISTLPPDLQKGKYISLGFTVLSALLLIFKRTKTNGGETK